MNKSIIHIILGLIFYISPLNGQRSVARQWNEANLDAIRLDLARPTIHARNLFHISAAMYDAYAVYDDELRTYFMGKTYLGDVIPIEDFTQPANIKAAQEEAISYAAYRMIDWRYKSAPSAARIKREIRELMIDLGYDPDFEDINYESGNAAALGNYIAQMIILFTQQDGSNEMLEYENQYYEPVNEPLNIWGSGNPDLTDPNRWQPLRLEFFVDQAGNVLRDNTPDFLSPEWGNVHPFSLSDDDKVVKQRDGNQIYTIYHDPGSPVKLSASGTDLESQSYKWGNALVAVWSSHLVDNGGEMIDISPGSLGNLSTLPLSYESYPEYYKFEEGGDSSTGHDLNPVTGQPYPPNLVPKGDYARVLAEFWADGPDSETPPGHWYTIFNTVSDHSLFERKFGGVGEELEPLKYDVMAYFTLGGAMHDSAIAAWSVKGYYDYIRPVSAIRYMCDQGQSSDPLELSYHPHGIPLIPGYIELIKEGDPLAGFLDRHVGKIKLYAWKGVIESGVDWVRAEQWWPYQRSSFVTPPFAGYVSGHSTFSRAAAEIMTLLTNDPFFPGGVGEFVAEANNFLVFEEGPSVDVILQWATYNDASDQTSLSRIWGGIHPPIDDIPGRIMGEKIGRDAFAKAITYFNGINPTSPGIEATINVFPNPIDGESITLDSDIDVSSSLISLFDIYGKTLHTIKTELLEGPNVLNLFSARTPAGVYFLNVKGESFDQTIRLIRNQ